MSKQKTNMTIEVSQTRKHRTRHISPRVRQSIFDHLRTIGVNSGMVKQLEIYNEAGGEQTVKMFEKIFTDQLEIQIPITLQALARKHGGEYQTWYDDFMSVAW